MLCLQWHIILDIATYPNQSHFVHPLAPIDHSGEGRSDLAIPRAAVAYRDQSQRAVS